LVVNNAGVMPLSPMEALKADEWDRMIDVNMRGVLHGIAVALPTMRAQDGGHFVNIASVGAYEVSSTARPESLRRPRASMPAHDGPRAKQQSMVRPAATAVEGVQEHQQHSVSAHRHGQASPQLGEDPLKQG
jgi:NAD(P)-dependent dehydrogenase (short-subunit alcohol dehydrogenase family)